jgi:hypothetical protein
MSVDASTIGTEMSDLLAAQTQPERKKPGPKPKPKPTEIQTKMTALVNMRWDAAKADENSIRRRYGKELTVPDALEELAALRKTCEIAGHEINQRLNHVDQVCASCGAKMDGRRPPTMIEPVRDAATGTLSNNYYCSIICVQRRNMKKLGREELIK